MTARIVDGSLDIMVFKDLKSDNYEVEFSIDTHDGVCFPDSFGKNTGKTNNSFRLNVLLQDIGLVSSSMKKQVA